MATPPGFDLDDVLGYALARLGHTLSQRFAELMASVGLTVAQFRVLAHLLAAPGLGAGAIARRIGIRPQSIGSVVETLVERGLVVREAPAGRGHRARLELTDEGRATVVRAMALAGAYNARMEAGLSAQRLDALRRDVAELQAWAAGPDGDPRG